VHLGHLVIAQDALEQLNLDQIVFIPAAQNPLKPNACIAGAPERLAMLQAATQANPAFSVDDYELNAPQPSYTIHTARAMRDRYEGAQLFWILGADAASGLARWHEVIELAKLLDFIILARPNEPLTLPDLPNLRTHCVNGHKMEISSSEIRQRLANGQNVEYFLHPTTNQIINQNQLYVRAYN